MQWAVNTTPSLGPAAVLGRNKTVPNHTGQARRQNVAQHPLSRHRMSNATTYRYRLYRLSNCRGTPNMCWRLTCPPYISKMYPLHQTTVSIWLKPFFVKWQITSQWNIDIQCVSTTTLLMTCKRVGSSHVWCIGHYLQKRVLYWIKIFNFKVLICSIVSNHNLC